MPSYSNLSGAGHAQLGVRRIAYRLGLVGQPQESKVVAGSGTRIAGISGLRGVVGDGLDPAVAVEFAAAYASECERGPIVVGHDGRVSARLFSAAVEAGVTATGRDVLFAGATATPTI